MELEMVKLTKKIILFIFLAIILVIVSLFVIDYNNDKTITNLKEFLKTDTKVLYITNDDNYNNKLIKLFKKYEINYNYIDYEKLDKIDESRLKKIIYEETIEDSIIIFKDGEKISKSSDIKFQKQISYLQENNIIPNIIEDIDGIYDTVKEATETDYTLLYLQYKKENEDQNEILKSISEENEINYVSEKIYLLSETQKQKINDLLEISSVDEQIIILIKDKTIIGNLREVENKEYYIKHLKEINFIKNSEKIEKINLDKFNKLIKSFDTNVIVIGNKENKDCIDLLEVLKEIDIETINYLELKDTNDNAFKDVQKRLNNIGFSEGFTLPILIITQNDKLLDYTIGKSTKEYYIELFTENGIIK